MWYVDSIIKRESNISMATYHERKVPHLHIVCKSDTYLSGGSNNIIQEFGFSLSSTDGECSISNRVSSIYAQANLETLLKYNPYGFIGSADKDNFSADFHLVAVDKLSLLFLDLVDSIEPYREGYVPGLVECLNSIEGFVRLYDVSKSFVSIHSSHWDNKAPIQTLFNAMISMKGKGWFEDRFFLKVYEGSRRPWYVVKFTDVHKARVLLSKRSVGLL